LCVDVVQGPPLGSVPNPTPRRGTQSHPTTIGKGFARREAASLAEGPVTFRDHFASLFQSAVLEIARKTTKRSAGRLESIGTNSSNAAELVLAAEKVVALLSGAPHSSRALQSVSGSALERMNVLDQAQACAALGWELMKAKLLGGIASVARVREELTAGTCDPLWAQTIEEYVRYFGPNGTRKPCGYRIGRRLFQISGWLK
jgi:hypothetical protein